MARFGSLDTQYFDDAGDPLVSGKIYFYESGTTTPKPTFSDVNYTIPNPNPVILTAAGRQPNIFFEGVAKAILTKADNTQILVRDPVGDTASTFGNGWIASKEYSANDVVQGSDGEFYRSLINGNVNNNPVTTTGSWTFLYSVEWSAGTTYKLGSVVTRNQLFYQSLQNANLNKDPLTENTWWVPIQLVWSETATYGLNSNVVGTDGILYTSIQAGNINNPPATSPLWWIASAAALTTVGVTFGGTGRTSLTAKNLIVGNGTSPVNFLAPGAAGSQLVSDGTDWVVETGEILGYTAQLETAAFSVLGGVSEPATSIDMDGDIEIIVGANSSGNPVAVAYDNSTDSFGSPLVIRADNCGTSGQFITAIKHSTTQLLVVSVTANSTALEAVIVTLNSGTLALTANTAATATLAGNINQFTPSNGIVALPSLPDSFVINYLRSTTTAAIRAISVSGTSVTIGSEQVLDGTGQAIIQPTADKVIAVNRDGTNVFTKPYTISGSTITAGSGTTTATAATISHFFPLGSRWGLLFSVAGTLSGAIVSISGTTTSITTATLFSAGSVITDAIVLSSTKVLALANAGAGANILTDNAGTAVAGTPIASFNDSAQNKICVMRDGTDVLVQEIQTSAASIFGVLDCSGSSPVKLRQLSLSGVTVQNTTAPFAPATRVLSRGSKSLYGAGFAVAGRNSSADAPFDTKATMTGIQLIPTTTVLGVGRIGRNSSENWIVANGVQIAKLEVLG